MDYKEAGTVYRGADTVYKGANTVYEGANTAYNFKTAVSSKGKVQYTVVYSRNGRL